LDPGAGHLAAKKHGQGSPVAENGDAIGDVAGHAIAARMGIEYAQDFAMALKPADFASLPALVNALRVTIKYKTPVDWRGTKENYRSEMKCGDTNSRQEFIHEFPVTFQLTTKGVLAREQARRKSRRFNNYDNFGPDGPDY
jgi:hypothetical protein